jgi:hypothetical protein
MQARRGEGGIFKLVLRMCVLVEEGRSGTGPGGVGRR